MVLVLLAQAAAFDVGRWAIIALIVAGIIGVVLVVARQANLNIPPFVATILWIILAVVLGVFAIRFLMGLAV